MKKIIGLLSTLIMIFILAGYVYAQQGEPVEESGELDVLIVDRFEKGHSEHHYYLRDQKGAGIRLFFEREPQKLSSGEKIKIKGRKNEEGIFVEELSLLAEPVSSIPQQTTDAPIIQLRKAVVLVVNLSNANAVATPSEAAGIMYSDPVNVDHLYRTASLDQLGFQSDTDNNGQVDVFGPYTISNNNSNCDYYGWATAAEAAAQADGVNLSLYQHRVFVLPSYSNLPACGWAGVANVGCSSYCRAWNAEKSLAVFAHELGHNLNMAHAGTDPENDGVMNYEYGDSSDVMGSSRARLTFNSGHVEQNSWFTPYAGSTVNVVSDGNYTLLPLDLDPRTTPGPRVLKIYKPNTNNYYYVSYRRNLTAYNGLSTTYTQGANIHRYAGSGYSYTYFIKSLTNGAQFIDAPNAITVTQLGKAADASTIDVNVDFGEVPCSPLTPSLGITPYDQAAKTGVGVNYSVSLTNRDSSSCPATTFDLTTVLPSGVTGSISPTYALLYPNQSLSANLKVSGSLEGRFEIRVNVQDNDVAEPNHNPGSATAYLTVDMTSPQTPTNLTATTGRKNQVTLTWDASSDGSGSGIAQYEIYRQTTSGLTLFGTSTTTTYSFRAQTGEYILSVKAVDRAVNASGLSNAVILTFTSPGKGRK